MARKLREQSSSGVYHIITRGINRQNIFEENKDYLYFLKILGRFSLENEISLYAYVLMNNHIHLLIRDKKNTLSRFMKQMGGMYCGYFNIKYGRSGGLFDGRFRSEKIENDSYLLTVLRYIHQNPLNAKMCAGIKDYKWSSYNEYLHGAAIIERDFILDIFGNNIKKFITFNSAPNSMFKSSIEYADRSKFSDRQVEDLIFKKYLIAPSKFISLPQKEKRELVETLRKERISFIQMSRILKISRQTLAKLYISNNGV